jgi:GTPase SAR1 family protein
MLDHNKKIVKLQIWDTSGQERFRTITSSYYRGVHALFVCADLSMEVSSDFMDNIHVWLEEVNRYAREDAPVFIMGMKADENPANTLKNIEELKKLLNSYFCPRRIKAFAICSAKEPKNSVCNRMIIPTAPESSESMSAFDAVWLDVFDCLLPPAEAPAKTVVTELDYLQNINTKSISVTDLATCLDTYKQKRTGIGSFFSFREPSPIIRGLKTHCDLARHRGDSHLSGSDILASIHAKDTEKVKKKDLTNKYLGSSLFVQATLSDLSDPFMGNGSITLDGTVFVLKEIYKKMMSKELVLESNPINSKK